MVHFYGNILLDLEIVDTFKHVETVSDACHAHLLQLFVS